MAVFILTAIVVAFLPPVFRTQVSLGGVHTNNVVGLVLGCLAATGSFRATVRRSRAKDAAKATRQSGVV